MLLRSAQALGTALRRIPRGWAGGLASAWVALIGFLGSRPAPDLGRSGPLGGVLANLAHAPEYGILALWLALCLPRRSGRDAWPDLAPRAIGSILAVVVLAAVLDELHQASVPSRDGSAFDVLTDFVGASATLSCVVAAVGPRACASALALRLIGGFFACVLAASLATFAPEIYPGHAWL